MPEQLIAGYNRFRKGYFLDNKENILQLAEGQSPRTAVISCCDSRVDPTIIFNATPGELFIVRNVANLVPACDNNGTPKGTSSALEFAVTGLEVSSIVILGHARCGGIKALMDREGDSTETFVDQWMMMADKTRKEIIAKNLPAEEGYIACEQGTIVQSLENLMTFPWIAERVNAGTLTLHGWYYDLHSAELIIYDPESKSFSAVPYD